MAARKRREQNPLKPPAPARSAAVMFQLEPDLKKKLIERANESDRSISFIVRQAVLRYLDAPVEAPVELAAAR